MKVSATIIKGYGVASGKANDPRFPRGTLELQKPFFRSQGLDLSQYYSGTLNISIKPYRYQVKQARYSFKQVKWSPVSPAEDFSFFDCTLVIGDCHQPGLVYYPHPDTKPEHFHTSDTLEILTTFIEQLTYGDSVEFDFNPAQLEIY